MVLVHVRNMWEDSRCRLMQIPWTGTWCNTRQFVLLPSLLLLLLLPLLLLPPLLLLLLLNRTGHSVVCIDNGFALCEVTNPRAGSSRLSSCGLQ